MFKYRGESSRNFYLKVGEGRILHSAEQDIQTKEVAGVDGELLIDNKRLKSVPLTIPCEIVLPENKSLEEISQEISNWLRGDVGWNDLELGNDPKYIRRAIHFEQYDIEKVFRHYGRSVLNFKCKPIKYLKSSLAEIVITNNQIIENTENTNSKPLIKIVGSGDITLTIGTKKLLLVGVDRGVIIDCDSESIRTHDGLRPAWGNMIDAEFPVIEQGKQKITWTGSVTQVKMVPRLGAKI